MRKAGGVLFTFGPDGIEETDTFTCAHCQRVTFVKPKEDPVALGGFCRVCDKLVCARCADGGCTPWEKQMEKMEARYHALRSYGLVE